MKRIAFIDLGSNSVRFVIYEISKTGSYRLIYQEKESVRLSENMWGTHELTKEAMERSLRVLLVKKRLASGSLGLLIRLGSKILLSLT